jgi:hypothetical protein
MEQIEVLRRELALAPARCFASGIDCDKIKLIEQQIKNYEQGITEEHSQ